jgi:hypothetical protein
MGRKPDDHEITSHTERRWLVKNRRRYEMTEVEIVYERPPYWIRRADHFKGFEVYRNVGTHSVRCASIGWPNQAGLDKAKKEIEKRLQKDLDRG